MFYLAFSNTDIQFKVEKLTWRFFTTAKTLSTVRQMELINKHKFVNAALNENSKTFVIYIAALKALEPTVYFFDPLY